jgi:hypothetical protein
LNVHRVDPQLAFKLVNHADGIAGQQASRPHQEERHFSLLRVIRPTQKEVGKNFLVFHGRLGIELDIRFL